MKDREPVTIAIYNCRNFRLTDEDIAGIRQFPSVHAVKIHESNEEIPEQISAEMLLVDPLSTKIPKSTLKNSPRLQFIQLNTKGTDSVPVAHATEAGIQVANSPHYASDSVAELVVFLGGAVARNIVLADRTARSLAETYKISYGSLFNLDIDPGNSEHDIFTGFTLRDKTWGLVGATGEIGVRVAQIVRDGFGMNVIGCNRSGDSKNSGIELVSFEEVLQQSDIVSSHFPYNNDSETYFDDNAFEMMKNGSVYVNVGRGENQSPQALERAINTGKLAGAGFDTIDAIYPQHELFNPDKNVIFSRHIGAATKEADEKLRQNTLRAIYSFASEEEMFNVVNAI